MGDTTNRRPLKSRDTGWAAAVLRLLLKTGLSADAVSILGVVISAAGAAALVYAHAHPWLFLLGALCIQLRLLANMMDGLVAVEGGRGGPLGPLFNEAPDRIEDTLFLVAFGIAAGWPGLGWFAAVLAVCAAYVRLLGGTLGFPQDFSGPMAKPHRMAALTLGCVLAFAEALISGGRWAALIVVWAVILGTLATIARRLSRQARLLKERAR